MSTSEIDALRREERLISSGSLSLDWERARAILGNYALPEKSMYGRARLRGRATEATAP